MENEILDNGGNEVVDEYSVTFSVPYDFEGTTYTELSLRDLNNLTAKDMVNTDRVLQRNGSASFLSEMTLEYALQMAARATKKPIEFFEQLPPRDAIKVKNTVTRFLFGRD